jgi:hypothetical chaperone protein
MIIGMDFGTTNSGMAAYDGQRLKFIPIDPASRSASVARTALYLTNDRQVYIGRAAIDTYYRQNLNRAVSIERVRVGEITLTFAELPSFVRDVYIDKDVLSPGRLFVSFKTALSSLNYLGTVVGSHFFFLEDIIALYLYIAKQRAEAFLGTEIRQIVLGRPVHFAFKPADDQLAAERLLKAAFRAGYDQVYLQYEPIAAAYQYESTIDREQNVLIFDFGGGTLDLSVVRLGNPKMRAVLANGGVPIAGDIFDQKLARARLPQHFGEGSFYRSGGKRMPVPSAFYEAFSNWQELLALQSPKTLEDIARIERSSERPNQIRALRSLISSSYSLKMYDIVESAKRQLSEKTRAEIELEGQGFDVYEPVHRRDFENVIRSEISTIEDYLDSLLRDAGLTSENIDVVIRTGGSSQIPVFVHMLESRFGADKVRSIDAFSSVTAGLGIIAHRIQQGELDAQVYRREAYPGYVDLGDTDGVPAVDFEVMKQFIALHSPDEHTQGAAGLVALTDQGEIKAALLTGEAPESDQPSPFADNPAASVISLPADAPVLLCTSEYRLLRKTPRELTRYHELGLDLADAEGFQRDVFGDEHITGISRYDVLKADEDVLFVTISGAYKAYKREELLPRIEQMTIYSIPRLKGDPLGIFGLPSNGEVVAFSAAGRVTRVRAQTLLNNNGRLMQVAAEDHLIAVFGIRKRTDFLLAEGNTVTQIASSDIPLVELSAPGAKVRKSLLSALPLGQSHVALTTERLFPMSGVGTLPLLPGERLISLLATS